MKECGKCDLKFNHRINSIKFVLVRFPLKIYSYFHVGSDIFITPKTPSVTNMIPALTERPFYQDISFLDLQLFKIIPHESPTFCNP